jgi:membrane-bound metal-dependent hydrolase YbcI (DUF457 family)
MNTPAHILIGAALFGRGPGRAVVAAAAIGAVLPDLSLYLLAGWALHVQQIPPSIVFDELYFSPAWQKVFAVDNSLVLWGGALMLGLALRKPVLMAFAGSGVLHLLLDLLLHAGDGRPHFWPFSDWVFDSPVSYWDSHHHASIVVPLSAMICVLAFSVLWRRSGWIGRGGGVALLGAEIWVAYQWLMFF